MTNKTKTPDETIGGFSALAENIMLSVVSKVDFIELLTAGGVGKKHGNHVYCDSCGEDGKLKGHIFRTCRIKRFQPRNMVKSFSEGDNDKAEYGECHKRLADIVCGLEKAAYKYRVEQ